MVLPGRFASGGGGLGGTSAQETPRVNTMPSPGAELEGGGQRAPRPDVAAEALHKKSPSCRPMTHMCTHVPCTRRRAMQPCETLTPSPMQCSYSTRSAERPHLLLHQGPPLGTPAVVRGVRDGRGAAEVAQLNGPLVTQQQVFNLKNSRRQPL